MGTLPQNYMLNAGTVLVEPLVANLVLNTQTGGDGTATVSDSTTKLRPGWTNAIKFEQTVGGTTDVTWNMDWAINTTLTNIGRFHIPFYADLVGATNGDVHSSGWNITMYVATDATYANRYQYQPATILPNYMCAGWNLATVDRATPYATTGSPTVGSTFTRFRLQLRAKAGTTGAFYFGPVTVNQHNRTKVCFGYEDCDVSQYTIAYPYLAARGIKGSQHIVSSFVDLSAQQLSTAQLQEMYDAGWSFHNHSDSHSMLSDLSVDAIKSDLGTCAQFLRNKGWTRGNSLFVYPRGPYSSTFFDTIESQVLPSMGMTHARVTRSNLTTIRDGLENPYRIAGWSTGSGVTLASLTGAVDDAVKNGSSVVFYTHDIGASPGANGVTTTIHNGLVDYVYRLAQSNVLDIVTMHELVAGLTNPRKAR